MKKIVTVGEFKEYCSKHTPQRVSICSEDQDGYCVADPVKFSMVFPAIAIFENPNVVYLTSREGTLQFDFVRRVEIDTDSLANGTIFTMFCGDGRRRDVRYKLLSGKAILST